jgi:pilus assembly protein CpaB
VGTDGKVTQVLLDDVLVIAVGTTSLTPVADAEGQASAAKADAAALVTVALPPATAGKLVHAIQTGTLYAALRGTDTKANIGQVISDSSLFSK